MPDAQAEQLRGDRHSARRRFGGTMPIQADTPNVGRASWVGVGVTLLLGIAIARYALRRDAAVDALATQIESAMTLRATELEAPGKSIGP